MRTGFALKRTKSVGYPFLVHKTPAAFIWSASHWPGRASPDRVLANFGLDLVGIHASTEVPGLVILAHVFETEPMILIETIAGFWRPMLGRKITIRMIAFAKPSRADRYFRLEFVRTSPHGRNMNRGPPRSKQGGQVVQFEVGRFL